MSTAVIEQDKVELTNKELKEQSSAMSIKTVLSDAKASLATLTPDKLKELAFISTYNTKDDQSTSPRKNGYQREPMPTRFSGIGRYYAKGDNRHLITPIIASVRVYSDKDRKRFNTLFAKGDIKAIHQEFTKSVFSIVDGQHRMNGLYWAWENIEDFNTNIPVMVYYGLRYEEEAKLFDDINTNQRKLPKALIESTKVHMEAGSDTHQQRIREIAYAVAQDGDSVWHGLVNMEGVRGVVPISYEGMRRAIASMFPEKLINRLKNRNLTPERVAKKYWEMVSKACAPAWENYPKQIKDDEAGEITEEPVAYRIKDVAGVASLAALAQDIITTSLDQSTRDDAEFWESVSDHVSRLGAVDWEKRPGNPWQIHGAGFAGSRGLYRVLYNLVYLDEFPGTSSND